MAVEVVDFTAMLQQLLWEGRLLMVLLMNAHSEGVMVIRHMLAREVALFTEEAVAEQRMDLEEILFTEVVVAARTIELGVIQWREVTGEAIQEQALLQEVEVVETRQVLQAQEREESVLLQHTKDICV